MATAVWTPAAEADLDDILYYIAMVDRRRATGERIYLEIRDRAFDQAAKPHTGHTHPDAPAGWLYCRYKRWLIFYCPSSEGIEVMRVVDAVRDLPRSLEG